MTHVYHRLIAIINICLVLNNFWIIYIFYDILVGVSVQLIQRLDKVLHMYNSSLCVLLPDDG